MHREYIQKEKGYSIVEVLVAIAVLMIAIVGPIAIASKGLQNAAFAREQNIAFFLAQEGIEAIGKKRDDAALSVISLGSGDEWDWIDEISSRGCSVNTACGVDFASNEALFLCEDGSCSLYLHDNGRARYRHQSSGGTLTRYSRKLYLDADSSRVHVRSVVEWGEPGDTTKSVTAHTYIYNIYGN